MTPGDAPDTSVEVTAVDVTRGTPTDEELAALIAVVRAAYAEEASSATAEDHARRSRWELSARGLRTPLPRDGGWGAWDR